MSLDDLRRHQEKNARIIEACEILDGLPRDAEDSVLSIDMTPGLPTVITLPCGMPSARYFDPPPEFEVVETDRRPGESAEAAGWRRVDEKYWRELDANSRAALAADVVAAEMLGGSGDLQRHSLVESPPAAGQREQAGTCEVAPEAGTGAGESPAHVSETPVSAPPAVAPAARKDQTAGQVTGPLTDDERAEIQRLDAEGVSRKEIARRLGRRTQTVALYLHGLAHPPKGAAGKTEESKAAQPAPVAEQASVAVSDGADAVAEAPVAVKAAPVGEIAEGVVPVAAPTPAPVAGGAAPFTARQRQIAAHVMRLHGRGDFDAATDLALVEQLTSGTKAGQVALDLGLDSAAVVGRFRALTAVIRDDRDRVTIDGQADLLLVLRVAAGVARPEAA
ncbi:helix-turn-helix domain-containing protein [Gemmobacter lutimaris]|nr:helix-turn-helix domain-containing protein [Gemmobacter lutimaris]